MSHEFIQTRFEVSKTILENLTTNRNEGPITLTATAADIIFGFAPAVPINVIRFGVIAKTAISAVGMVLTLSRTSVLNDLSAPTSFGTLTTTAVAANKGAYRDVLVPVAASSVVGLNSALPNLVNVKPVGPMEVNPGQAAIITLTTVASVSGTGYVFIEYTEQGFSGTRIANYTKVTS